jgi:hypothetical protein
LGGLFGIHLGRLLIKFRGKVAKLPLSRDVFSAVRGSTTLAGTSAKCVRVCLHMERANRPCLRSTLCLC